MRTPPERGRCPGRPIRITTSTRSGPSSSTALRRSTAGTASTRISSPPTARPRRCSMPRGGWRCRCSTTSTPGRTSSPPTTTRRGPPSPRPARRACRRAQSSARRSSGSSAAFPRRSRTAPRSSTYPQYWAFRLTGVAATEVTSLGCHTDLWNPRAGAFSSLVERDGLAPRYAAAPARLRPARADPAEVAARDRPRRRRRRSTAASTIPTPRCCRTLTRGRRPSRWSRPAPG